MVTLSLMWTCDDIEMAWITQFVPEKMSMFATSDEEAKDPGDGFLTDVDVVPDSHWVIVDLASADTAWRFDDAPGMYDCAPSYADAGGGDIFAGLRRDCTCRVQVASELYIRHDDSAAPEHNVCCPCDSCASRDFIA
jgi:hypothetical protein